jgi:hypothetical protein
MNADKMNAPLALSFSPLGGERVAAGRERGLLFQMSVHLCQSVI